PVNGWKTNISYIWNGGNLRTTEDRKTITQATTTEGVYYNWRFLNPSFIENYSKKSYHLLNIFSSYEKSIKDHRFFVLAGYEQEYSNISMLGGEKFGIITSEVPSVSTGTERFLENSSWTHWATQGVFGRFTYNFKEKYLFEF